MPPILTFILRPVIFFVVTVVMFLIWRICFVIFYPELFNGLTSQDYWQITYHGFAMDACVAGYLTIIPWLIACIGLWLPGRKSISTLELGNISDAVRIGNPYGMVAKRTVRIIMIIYMALVSLAIGFIATLDAALYPIWGFRLDLNPFYYLASAPITVLKSLSSSEFWGGLLGTLILASIWFAAYFLTWYQLHFRPVPTKRLRYIGSGIMLLMGGLLFIVIRGGVTVSTMNLSRAYFSNDSRINHASINPAFSLISSIAHQSHELSKYHFYPSSQIPELISVIGPVSGEGEGQWQGGDSIISTKRPDIYLIILESFSAHLFPSLGGEDIAVNLDKVASEGLLFTNAYANSFRTDRALPAILNSFPGLPDQGISKDVVALERLPSLGKYLNNAGYKTEYYYGGDLNFANMQALLIAGGFERIVGDKDFPLTERLGKWGAHDDVLFKKVKRETRMARVEDRRPLLRVIQTSSSHEPFDVPYHKLSNPAANSFAFTDSVVGDYIDFLKKTPEWKNALVILVPDHYGAYPKNPGGLKERHHIPIIFTGGTLLKKGSNGRRVTQVAITPTILGLLGINHDRFFFGRNMFDKREVPLMYIYDREEAMLQSDQGTAIYNVANGDMTVMPVDSIDVMQISPLNPKTQLRAWMQAISGYYDTGLPQ